MENIAPKPTQLTQEELNERQYRQKQRENRIALMRSMVLRKQITEAYEILENIRFDYLGDTAFREKIINAKRSLELAMDDFLLDSVYHKEVGDRLNIMSPCEYNEYLSKQAEQPTCNSIK